MLQIYDEIAEKSGLTSLWGKIGYAGWFQSTQLSPKTRGSQWLINKKMLFSARCKKRLPTRKIHANARTKQLYEERQNKFYKIIQEDHKSASHAILNPNHND